MKKLFTLLFSLLFTASVFAGEFPDISIADLKKAIDDKKVTVIDVNGTDSWKAGHVPTAIDFDTAGDKLADKLPRTKTPSWSLIAAVLPAVPTTPPPTKAKELGYTNVKHLSAGISGWKKAGEKTEAGK